MITLSVTDIPSEVLFHIFSMLEFDDLESVLTVCKKWRDIGEDPNLWSKYRFCHLCAEDLTAVLKVPRFSKLRSLKVTDDEIFDEFFHRVSGMRYLEELDLTRSCVGMDELEEDGPFNSDPDLVSEVLNSIPTVIIQRTNFSRSQLLNFFERMALMTKIETLVINTTEEEEDDEILIELCDIPPETLGRAIANLKYAYLAESCLTPDHIDAILSNIVKTKKTRGLCLANNNLCFSNRSLMAFAINSLTYCDLSGTDIGETGIAQALFDSIHVKTSLKILDISFTNLGEDNDNNNENSILFGGAVNKLEELRMIGTCVSSNQIQDLVKHMCLKNSRLKVLHFEDVHYDPTLVNPNFLAAGFNKLTKLRLGNSSFNNGQINELFSRIADSTKLEYLDVSFLNLKSVPPIHISKSVHNIKKVILNDSGLSNNQIIAILKPSNPFVEFMKFSRMKTSHLDLSQVSLADIDANILAKALVHVETVRLVSCELLPEQVEQILKTVKKDSKLKNLEVSEVDLEDVDESEVENSSLANLKILELDENYQYDEDNVFYFHDLK